MADSPFTTGNEVSQESMQQFLTLLKQILPDFGSSMAQSLLPIIGPMLGGYPGQGRTPGGTPYSAGGWASEVNAGRSLVNSMQKTFIDDTTKSSLAVIQGARTANADWFNSAMGNQGANASALTFTNMVANTLFNTSVDPRQVLAGAREAAMYQGVANIFPGMPGWAADYNRDRGKQMSALNAAVVGDFVNNGAKYGGVTGKEFGQIWAEMSRTGQISPWMEERTRLSGKAEKSFGALVQNLTGPGNLDPKLMENASRDVSEMDRMTSALQEEMRQTSTAVKRLQEVFGNGSTMMELLDSFRSLTGTATQATLGGAGFNRMTRQMVASGQVSGFTPEQMFGLMGTASAYMEAQGLSQTSAPMAGIGAAMVIGGVRQSAGISGYDAQGNPVQASAFVNDAKQRIELTRMTAMAQEGRTGQIIAGAAVLMSQQGRGPDGKVDPASTKSMEGMLQQLYQNPGSLTDTDIVKAMKDNGYTGDVNVGQMWEAGGTVAAQDVRNKDPRIGMIGTMAGAARISGQRQETFDAMLKEAGVSDKARQKAVKEVQDSSDGFTDAGTARALRNVGELSVEDQVTLEGRLRRLNNTNAEAMGMQAGTADQLVRMMHTGGKGMYANFEAVKQIEGIEGDLENVGNMRGFRGLLAMTQSTGVSDATIGNVLRFYTGDMNLTEDQATRAAGVHRQIANDMKNNPNQASQYSKYGSAVNIALTGKTLAGTEVDADTKQQAIQALASGTREEMDAALEKIKLPEKDRRIEQAFTAALGLDHRSMIDKKDADGKVTEKGVRSFSDLTTGARRKAMVRANLETLDNATSGTAPGGTAADELVNGLKAQFREKGSVKNMDELLADFTKASVAKTGGDYQEEFTRNKDMLADLEDRNRQNLLTGGDVGLSDADDFKNQLMELLDRIARGIENWGGAA